MSATLSTRDLVAYVLSELQVLVLKAETLAGQAQMQPELERTDFFFWVWAQQSRLQGRDGLQPWAREIDKLVDTASALGALGRVARLHGDVAAGDEIDAAVITAQHQLIDLCDAARAAALQQRRAA